MKFKTIYIILIIFSQINIASAAVREYELTIRYQSVNITGHDVQAMTINDSIPGPTLRFKEGDFARIHVRNEMDVETSIHWHGILLPNLQDGVPYLTTPPVLPGTTYTYEFPIKHSGTYWYHSHTGLQEQRGVFGSIVIEPAEPGIQSDQDHVVVFSDWTDENPDEVLRTLKSGNDYYSLKKGSMQSMLGAVKVKALQDVMKRSWMRMPPMDISDIAYDRFLVNGKPSATLDARTGQTVLLRIINASASTYFYLQFAGGDMKVVSADGVDVQPVNMKRFLIAVAETYDVIVTIPENGAYELRATSQDGSGQASLFIGEGDRISAPDVPKPNLYKMHSGGHGGSDGNMNDMGLGSGENMRGMGHGSDTMIMPMNERPQAPYENLKSPSSTALKKDLPVREIRLELTGDMERYVWSLNGKTLNEADVIRIKKGENVRFVLVNKTMMHHPMHLHGHFFRVVNKHGDYSPLKHTVDVPPLGTRVMEFYANEEKDWFFHCHVLYHLKAGMANIVKYENSTLAPDIAAIRPGLFKEHWYFWADISLLTQMTEGRVVAADTRNTLSAVWEAGWDEDYEVEITYERYLNRFFNAFAGGILTDGEQNHRGIIGIKYLLPFLFESSVWLDTEGEVRLSLEKEIQLTDRLYAFGEFQYDTESKEEWLTGAGCILSKNITLIGQYHSEYKGGIGLNIRF
jgi:FtsP/CotA-like multicopper oxidase with cupredoxin domain